MEVTFNYNDSKIQIFKIFSGTLAENVPMHSHPKNGYELHLIDSGEGILETDNKKYPISKNTLFITGPNAMHKQIPNKENPMHELCVYFKIAVTKNHKNAINHFTDYNFWIGKSNAEIRRLFKQIILENEKNSICKNDILAAISLRIISEITRLYHPDNADHTTTNKNTDLNESRSWILDQLFLDDCSNVTLTDFADNIGVSPRQAERIIKDYYGLSFKKMRYEAKMATAATLLEQNNISIEECASKCGYTCASAFINAFKQKYKITPKAYQEQFR